MNVVKINEILFCGEKSSDAFRINSSENTGQIIRSGKFDSWIGTIIIQQLHFLQHVIARFIFCVENVIASENSFLLFIIKTNQVAIHMMDIFASRNKFDRPNKTVLWKFKRNLHHHEAI